MISLTYTFNKSTEQQIKEHLWRVDKDFKPALHTYVDIDSYSKKLANSAVRLEYFNENQLIGLMASYFNLDNKFLFITNFSIEKEYRGQGMNIIVGLIKFLEGKYSEISTETLNMGLDFAKALHIKVESNKTPIKSIHTEVRNDNQILIYVYKKIGFYIKNIGETSTYLIREI
ncbi:GNAT family N-acetyltransferase [Aequorivita sp. KMM 9714]|uniref:GNAT family N-acetyltransferase n=1 Tax=Aequorivita sp. KMM 9714 TaxID=2707173 RepID=UPI0013EAF578|nr:GNAT family N-acetyltransferase [Aequorivita sp. KMM 9714]NGX84747.1 GNAT family N-acetyltransferase [Aequorivita sp. KMM 9714]